jgi:hypothetical protein
VSILHFLQTKQQILHSKHRPSRRAQQRRGAPPEQTCARPQPTSTADRDAALNQSNLAPGNGGEQWPAEIRRDLELASGAEEEKPEGGEPGEGRDGPAG